MITGSPGIKRSYGSDNRSSGTLVIATRGNIRKVINIFTPNNYLPVWSSVNGLAKIIERIYSVP